MNSDNPFDIIYSRFDRLESLMLEFMSDFNKQVIPEEKHKSNLVKIEEAVKLTGYKKGYIYELVCHNKIPHLKRGKSLRFDPDELDKWMKAGRPDIIKNAIQSL